jgi:phosphoserine phosphatase
MGLAPAQTIAMGDGANDLKMLAVAGLGVGMHPKPVVRQHADVSLRYVGLDGLPRLFAPAVS